MSIDSSVAAPPQLESCASLASLPEVLMNLQVARSPQRPLHDIRISDIEPLNAVKLVRPKSAKVKQVCPQKIISNKISAKGIRPKSAQTRKTRTRGKTFRKRKRSSSRKSKRWSRSTAVIRIPYSNWLSTPTLPHRRPSTATTDERKRGKPPGVRFKQMRRSIRPKIMIDRKRSLDYLHKENVSFQYLYGQRQKDKPKPRSGGTIPNSKRNLSKPTRRMLSMSGHQAALRPQSAPTHNIIIGNQSNSGTIYEKRSHNSTETRPSSNTSCFRLTQDFELSACMGEDLGSEESSKDEDDTESLDSLTSAHSRILKDMPDLYEEGVYSLSVFVSIKLAELQKHWDNPVALALCLDLLQRIAHHTSIYGEELRIITCEILRWCYRIPERKPTDFINALQLYKHKATWREESIRIRKEVLEKKAFGERAMKLVMRVIASASGHNFKKSHIFHAWRQIIRQERLRCRLKKEINGKKDPNFIKDYFKEWQIQAYKTSIPSCRREIQKMSLEIQKIKTRNACLIEINNELLHDKEKLALELQDFKNTVRLLKTSTSVRKKMRSWSLLRRPTVSDKLTLDELSSIGPIKYEETQDTLGEILEDV